jgi:hypothetical protein
VGESTQPTTTLSINTNAATAIAVAPTIRVVDTRFPAATAGVAAVLTSSSFIIYLLYSNGSDQVH